MFSARWPWYHRRLCLTMRAAEEHLVVRGHVAKTGSSNGQTGSSHQRSKQGGDAVDLQDEFNGRVHTVAVRVDSYVKGHVS